jgi:hypothetical protein
MSMSARLLTLSTLALLVASTGCSAATGPDPATDDAEQRGKKGAAGAATTAGDGSFAECIDRQSGFGSISYFNHCARTLNVVSCDKNNTINPSASCIDPVVNTFAPQTAIGFTKGHCTPPCAAPGVADFAGTCNPPSIPVAVNGDLSQGYTCK